MEFTLIDTLFKGQEVRTVMYLVIKGTHQAV